MAMRRIIHVANGKSDKWKPKNRSFTEANDPSDVAAKVQEFKQKFNYTEEDGLFYMSLEAQQARGNRYRIRRGFITITNPETGKVYKLALVDDNMYFTTLNENNLKRLGATGPRTWPPPYNAIHVPYTMILNTPMDQINLVLLHEVGHQVQVDYADDLKGATKKKAQKAGLGFGMFNQKKIHGDPMEEVDADTFAARITNDPDGFIQAIHDLYKNAMTEESMDHDYGKWDLPPAKKSQLSQMMDKEYASLRRKVQIAAKIGIGPAKKWLTIPVGNRANVIEVVAAALVCRKWNKENVLSAVDPYMVLWNSVNHKACVQDMIRYQMDPSGPANADFIQRKQAMELAKKRGLRNPFTPAKPGEVMTLDKVIDGWDDDFIPEKWIQKNKLDQLGYDRNAIREDIKKLFADVLNRNVDLTKVVDGSTGDGYNHASLTQLLRRIARELMWIKAKENNITYRESALSDDELDELVTFVSEACVADEAHMLLEFKIPKIGANKNKTIEDARRYIQSMVNEVKTKYLK